MFDNTTQISVNNHTVSFNSVSGTLVKSCSESKIIRFHMSSARAQEFFDLKNQHYYEDYKYHYIVVLQVMLCAGDQYLVEFMELEKDEK